MQVASTAPDAKEKFNVDGLTIEGNSPPNATSSTRQVFRRYSNEKRDEFAVCLYCKRAGKTNTDSEVKYGSSHSTSKLHQHIVSCHKEDHKRKIEAIVETVGQGQEYAESYYFDHLREIQHNVRLVQSDQVDQLILKRIQDIIYN